MLTTRAVSMGGPAEEEVKGLGDPQVFPGQTSAKVFNAKPLRGQRRGKRSQMRPMPEPGPPAPTLLQPLPGFKATVISS